MGVLDDYLYQKENRYRKNEKYMSSYDKKNVKEEISSLKSRVKEAARVKNKGQAGSVLEDYLYQKENRYRKNEKYMSNYDKENVEDEINTLKSRIEEIKRVRNNGHQGGSVLDDYEYNKSATSEIKGTQYNEIYDALNEEVGEYRTPEEIAEAAQKIMAYVWDSLDYGEQELMLTFESDETPFIQEVNRFTGEKTAYIMVGDSKVEIDIDVDINRFNNNIINSIKLGDESPVNVGYLPGSPLMNISRGPLLGILDMSADTYDLLVKATNVNNEQMRALGADFDMPVYINQTKKFGDGEYVGNISYGGHRIDGNGCILISTVIALYNMGYMTQYDSIREAVQDAANYIIKNKKPSNGNAYYGSNGAVDNAFMNDYIYKMTGGDYRVSDAVTDRDAAERALKNSTQGALVNIQDYKRDKDGKPIDRTFDFKDKGTEGHQMFIKYNPVIDMYTVLNPNSTGGEAFENGKIFFTFDEVYEKVKNGFYVIEEADNNNS